MKVILCVEHPEDDRFAFGKIVELPLAPFVGMSVVLRYGKFSSIEPITSVICIPEEDQIIVILGNVAQRVHQDLLKEKDWHRYSLLSYKKVDQI